MKKEHTKADGYTGIGNGIQYSSSDTNEGYVRPRRHPRRLRKRSEPQFAERKSRDEYDQSGNEYSTGYTTQKKTNMLKYNRFQQNSSESEDTVGRKRNVKISVKPLCPNAAEKHERPEFETCHKAMEPRGYCPRNEEAPRSPRCDAKSPCTSRGASTCRDHIYRPVIDQTRKRCDDDFICGLQARCEADRKYTVGNNVHCKGENSGREDIRINDTILYKPIPCEKHHKECQTAKCNDESSHSNNPIRYNELTLFPIKSCGNSQHSYLDYIIHQKKDDLKTSHEKREHLFPFKRTPEGKLQFDSSMVYYQDDKMTILVADPTKVGVRFKSSVHPKCGRKKHKESKKVKKVPRTCVETDVERKGLCCMNVQTSERACDLHNLR